MGDLNTHNVDDLCLMVEKIRPNSVIYLSELDIDDGVSMAVLVTSLRKILPCTLVEAPRMLAHTLYKINAKGILLVKPRTY